MTDRCFELILEIHCNRDRLLRDHTFVQAEPGYTAPISKDAEEHATTPMAITKAAMEAQLQEAKTAAERAQRSQRTAEADR